MKSRSIRPKDYVSVLNAAKRLRMTEYKIKQVIKNNSVSFVKTDSGRIFYSFKSLQLIVGLNLVNTDTFVPYVKYDWTAKR